MSEWRALPVAGQLFESARWLEHEQCFQWVDILSARLFRWAPATDALESVEMGFDFLTLATPSPTPGMQFLADRDTVYTHRWGDPPEPFAVLPVGADARLNDGILDRRGRLWIGSMGLVPSMEAPLGKLWRLDASGSASEMLSDLGISNGIAWATDYTGFHVDSLAGALYSLTDKGESVSRTMALKFSSPVEPDGIVIADEIVWLALWGGSALGRFDPSSDRYDEVPVPAGRPSSLAMSPELVLVTTAGQGTESDLDRSGQVLAAPLASLHAVHDSTSGADEEAALAQAGSA